MKLNREHLPVDRRIGASALATTETVHIGIVQFHRAHAVMATVQVLAAEPGEWGTVGVASHNLAVVNALHEQDGAYPAPELTSEGESASAVDVRHEFAVTAEEIKRVLDLLVEPRHKIVTLTVSGNGYCRDSRTGDLDRSDSAVLVDFAGGAQTTVGLAAHGFVRRFERGDALVTVPSCDNMVSAGDVTRSLVAKFLEEIGVGPEFFVWLETNVTFPDAMVDRIVPTTTDAVREAVRRTAGFDDTVPVPAEGFTMQVMEDKFAAGRPAWEHADGVVFTDEIGKYELVKLHLLNGSHSPVSYLGALDGRETVPASRTQPFVEECVRAVLYDEHLSSIDLPLGFDLDIYIAWLFAQWTNFALGDRTARVGPDGSTKLPQYIPAPAIWLLEKGSVLQQMAPTAAAQIAYVCPPQGFDPSPIACEMAEPKREVLVAATAGASNVREHVDAVIRGGFLPDELAVYEAFTRRMAELVEAIVRDGVHAAAVDVLAKRPLEGREGQGELLSKPEATFERLARQYRAMTKYNEQPAGLCIPSVGDPDLERPYADIWSDLPVDLDLVSTQRPPAERASRSFVCAELDSPPR